jgi:hypothetical protein
VGPVSKSEVIVKPVTVAVLALACALGSSMAQAAPHRANMTGGQLVHDILAAPDGGLNSIRRERAMGYMDGVMDAAAGLPWCPARQALPHELNYLVVEDMQPLGPDQPKGNAAVLQAGGELRDVAPPGATALRFA